MHRRGLVEALKKLPMTTYRSKPDFMNVTKALKILRRRPLKFGDPEQIAAARYLESLNISFRLTDFLTGKELRERHTRNQAAG